MDVQLLLALVDKSFTIFQAIDYIKEHEPNARILYLVFNKANEIEAKYKLRKYAGPFETVTANTAHSFASRKWTSIFGKYATVNSLDWNIIKDIIQAKGVYNKDIRWSKKAPFVWLHNKYCSYPRLLDNFIEDMEFHWDDHYDGDDKPKYCTIINSKGEKEEKYGIPVDAYSVVTFEHIQYFKKIYEEHINRRTFTHSMYLKHAAMSPKAGGSYYDYVFFDEAQDANRMMLKLLSKQEVRKTYFIGDERQSIYDFDGSNVNVFKTLHFDKMYSLSTSFRFGDGIAELANRIIHIDSSQTVYGSEQTHETNLDSTAFLFRTNAKLFETALDFAYKEKKKGYKLRIDFMNRVNEDDNAFNEIMSFLGLYYKWADYSYYCQNVQEFPKQLAPSLSQFSSRLEKVKNFYKVYAEQFDALSDDVKSIYEYTRSTSDFIAKYKALKECLMECNPERIVTMITMHRSKGLQWDTVIIAEPTKLYFEDKNGTIRRNPKRLQEMNLMYVAVTRARKSLNAKLFLEDLQREDYDNFKNLTMLVRDNELLPEQKETCNA